MQDVKNVTEMTDREILVETLTRLRAYEDIGRKVIEAGKNNPMLSALLRANGVPV